jgi:hypothetical protein
MRTVSRACMVCGKKPKDGKPSMAKCTLESDEVKVTITVPCCGSQPCFSELERRNLDGEFVRWSDFAKWR